MYTQQTTQFFSGGYSSVFGVGGFGNCVGTVACAADTILFIINGILVPVLFAVAFIVFLYGIARAYIFSIGDAEGVKKGHTLMLWGIIGFVVMISLWGLVNIVANTFGLGGYGAPSTPVSYPIGGTTYGPRPETPTYVERCQVEGNCPEPPTGAPATNQLPEAI